MSIPWVRDGDGVDLPWRYVAFEFGNSQSEDALVEIDLPRPLEPTNELELQIGFTVNNAKFFNDEMIILQDDPYHSFDGWYPKAMTKSGDDWSINDDRT